MGVWPRPGWLSGGRRQLCGRRGAEGLEGVTGGKPRPEGAGWDPQGGVGPSRDPWRGLGVERWMGRVEGASEVAGAGQPSSPTSMVSSLSDEASDSSSSEGRGASDCGGGTGLAFHSLEKELWSSPQFGQ